MVGNERPTKKETNYDYELKLNESKYEMSYTPSIFQITDCITWNGNVLDQIPDKSQSFTINDGFCSL